ncbi:MAG: tRNA (uridine(34)/cytosine(34)/5-carboxymethylaminomethyluridine(34)-2'-O)-methyltransferase TrmL [Gammaproteobacteria bacterium]|jgi:tRNA (cytidine/uridine-2'-O-)-methyltransferase|nr:tRNA (uridine(34)/cytosine(34)/5-carboxymethylaminomethyluridine(34)-2'-O)-methyltransferase TrmL [Gammaproteobacteria bacterium]MBT6892176.1 tRNA (uridine(34)/cytosine(34)/5-carboxymethylaminomethyluridine(34)-2'-O)-methyltransferase TrmL [Gammaproteobacteria bacterium]MDG1233529.1 tRNA (uridine(34)/cytosine(34)/5-carboxymethylaminomethyluridine(34)-2'-O)-methyltransferase TrmL [Pseudomonadales bacterium]
MLNIVLYEPEIPPNTGNIMRLCANTGCTLHLVKPLGFELDDKQLRRAGLDYREYADVREWDNLGTLLDEFDRDRVFAITTKGLINHTQVEFKAGDILIFGPETRGLPDAVLALMAGNRKLRIPMLQHSRSLNLSNAAAIVVYEAWRQLGFQSGL